MKNYLIIIIIMNFSSRLLAQDSCQILFEGNTQKQTTSAFSAELMDPVITLGQLKQPFQVVDSKELMLLPSTESYLGEVALTLLQKNIPIELRVTAEPVGQRMAYFRSANPAFMKESDSKEDIIIPTIYISANHLRSRSLKFILRHETDHADFHIRMRTGKVSLFSTYIVSLNEKVFFEQFSFATAEELPIYAKDVKEFFQHVVKLGVDRIRSEDFNYIKNPDFNKHDFNRFETMGDIFNLIYSRLSGLDSYSRLFQTLGPNILTAVKERNVFFLRDDIGLVWANIKYINEEGIPMQILLPLKLSSHFRDARNYGLLESQLALLMRASQDHLEFSMAGFELLRMLSNNPKLSKHLNLFIEVLGAPMDIDSPYHRPYSAQSVIAKFNEIAKRP